MAKHEVAWKEFHYAIIDIEPGSDKDTILDTINGIISIFTREYTEIKYCKRVFNNENQKR